MPIITKLALNLILGLTSFLPSGRSHPVASRAPCTAVCSCSSRYRNFAERVQGTTAIFVGTVVDVRDHEKGRRNSYTFAVDKSWKGPSADTIIVYNTGRVCEPLYLVGGTYLVFAGSTTRGLHVPMCADAIHVSDATEKLTTLDALIGRARSTDQRSIDGLVRQTLERQRKSIVEPVAVINVRTRWWYGIPDVKIELLGTELSAVTNSEGRAVLRSVALGWHRVRLTFAGTPEDHYIRLRCRTDIPFNPGKGSCWITEPTLIPRGL